MANKKFKENVKAAGVETMKVVNEVSAEVVKAATPVIENAMEKAEPTIKKAKAAVKEAAEKAEPTVEKAKAAAKEAAKKAEPTVKKATDAAKKAAKKAEPTVKRATRSVKAAGQKLMDAIAPEVYVQMGAAEFTCTNIVERCKDDYKAAHKDAILSCKVYIKPEDAAAYYVINGETGKVAL